MSRSGMSRSGMSRSGMSRSGMMPRRYSLERAVGSAAEFHARPIPDPARRVLWWFDVTCPTVVLGSTQKAEVIDEEAARLAGVEVVRRRSGGGAVWLARSATTWVDVILPATDPRWEDDVSRSALWLGEAWVAALERVGRAGLDVHRGALARLPWSDLVCFAGLAPGEVTMGTAKVVGISQRRTRAAARFQCAVVHRWDPAPLLEVLALSPGERDAAADDLRHAGAGIGAVAPSALVTALLEELRHAPSGSRPS